MKRIDLIRKIYQMVLVLTLGLLYACGGGGGSDPVSTSTTSTTASTTTTTAGDLALVDMPGTQPLAAGTFKNVSYCQGCHADYNGGSGGVADEIAEGPFETWRVSMMANAARDPLFWALVASQNKAFASRGVAIGDFCLRCHVPKGWLENRSEPADGSAFEARDLDGIICDVCHRMVDPKSAEGQGMVDENVDFYRNAQFVVDSSSKKRGPYDDSASPSHATEKSDFHLSSDFCGTCHEITNPFYDNAVMVEKTYTEWKYSVYADQASVDHKECQDCHMPVVTGYASNFMMPLRDDIALHRFIGGNAWAPSAIAEFDDSFSQELAQETRGLAVSMLQSAADLAAVKDGDNLKVTVTNLSGHKLPTGFTEGRRIWVNVKFYDSSGVLVQESGAYDESTAVLSIDDNTKVYEATPGLQGVDGYSDGASFHFGLNNVILKDNRIPPKGFTNAEFEANGAHIVGAVYSDGQNFDITTYLIPSGAVSADVTLYYQTTTREFVEFLRDDNIDNPYDHNGAGAQIYQIWESTGKAAPVIMARQSSVALQ